MHFAFSTSLRAWGAWAGRPYHIFIHVLGDVFAHQRREEGPGEWTCDGTAPALAAKCQRQNVPLAEWVYAAGADQVQVVA